MRRLILAAVAAFALASVASAADPAGPYKLDAKGKCRAANGQFVKTALCKPAAAPKHCRDPKTGKFAKCTVPGAVPA
jgi:hypothetical protein